MQGIDFKINVLHYIYMYGTLTYVALKSLLFVHWQIATTHSNQTAAVLIMIMKINIKTN